MTLGDMHERAWRRVEVKDLLLPSQDSVKSNRGEGTPGAHTGMDQALSLGRGSDSSRASAPFDILRLP